MRRRSPSRLAGGRRRGAPGRTVLATIGNLHIQLPVAAASLTAIGFHGANDGSLSLQPVGRQANAGMLARLWRRIAGSGSDSPRWYQLEGATQGTNMLDVGAPPGRTSTRPCRARSSQSATSSSAGRNVGSRIDLRPLGAPSVMVSRPATCEPDPDDRRRLAGARRVVEARHGRRSRGRRAAGARARTPRTAGTTSRSSCTRRPARCPSGQP